MFDSSRRGEYDVVVFQKAYDDASRSSARSLRQAGTITVFDLCDNHFYNPDGLPELAERGRRLARMLDTVDAVSVSSSPLRELVAEHDPPVIDDALDESPRGDWRHASRGRHTVCSAPRDGFESSGTATPEWTVRRSGSSISLGSSRRSTICIDDGRSS